MFDNKELVYQRKRKGLSQEEFGKKLGVSKQMVSHWENGRNDINPKYHERICEILDIPIYDLTFSEPDKTPIELIAKTKDLHLHVPNQAHSVPVLTAAQAKGWDADYEAIDDYIDYDSCPQEFFFGDDIKPDWIAVRVNGNSMGNELPHGSTVLVDMGTPYPKRGKRVLAKLKTGELVIKRYFRKDNVIRLESDGDGMHWKWHCKEDSSPIYWMRPIKQIVIKED